MIFDIFKNGVISYWNQALEFWKISEIVLRI